MSTDTATVRRSRRNQVSMAAPPPDNPNETGRGSGRAFTIISWVVLIVFSVLGLIPSLWAVKTSLTANSTSAIGAGPILHDWNLPLASYLTLLGSGDLWNWYLASAVTSVVTVFLTVIFG